MSAPLRLVGREERPVQPREKLRLLSEIEKKVLWLSSWMIHNANHLRPARDGLKVGGHQSSCASAVTLLTALAPFPNLVTITHLVKISAAVRSAQFSAAFDKLASRTVRSAGPQATYVSPSFTGANAVFAPDSLLWNGSDDPVHAEREAACDAAKGGPLCWIASLGHPNLAGAKRYAERIELALQGWTP